MLYGTIDSEFDQMIRDAMIGYDEDINELAREQ